MKTTILKVINDRLSDHVAVKENNIDLKILRRYVQKTSSRLIHWDEAKLCDN